MYNLSCWETCDSSAKPPRNRSQTSLTLSVNSTMSPRWRYKKYPFFPWVPHFPRKPWMIGWSAFIFAKRCIIPTTSAASRRVLGHVRYAFLHCSVRISDCNPYILLKLHMSDCSLEITCLHLPTLYKICVFHFAAWNKLQMIHTTFRCCIFFATAAYILQAYKDLEGKNFQPEDYVCHVFPGALGIQEGILWRNRTQKEKKTTNIRIASMTHL